MVKSILPPVSQAAASTGITVRRRPVTKIDKPALTRGEHMTWNMMMPKSERIGTASFERGSVGGAGGDVLLNLSLTRLSEP